MSRLTRDGTAEPVSRNQMLRHERVCVFGDLSKRVNFPCSVDHEQDWQPYPVDPHSAYINTYILVPGVFVFDICQIRATGIV